MEQLIRPVHRSSIKYDMVIVSAPSVLGLRPSGVEDLGNSLLAAGLAELLNDTNPVLHVPTANHLYNNERDKATNCLNPIAVKNFSSTLVTFITQVLNKNKFAFVLGGDCSILLGILPAVKMKDECGLVFIDAHADFYEPEKSQTGELADMDLAIATGRGPELLTNMYQLRPYVQDENVIHIGQRDWEETKRFGSQDIRETRIKCFDLDMIDKQGIEPITKKVLEQIAQMNTGGFWIHFDTDVLDDTINPAVDYRIPGGLSFAQVEYLLKKLLLTGKAIGISITIFNPKLDPDGTIAGNIASSLGRAFS